MQLRSTNGLKLMLLSYSVPINSLLVDEDPHEFGDGHRRMCVVQLNGNLLRHLGEVVARNFANAELGVLVPESDDTIVFRGKKNSILVNSEL